LESAIKEIENGHYIQCDVTDEIQVEELVQKIKKDFGNLNVLMNNAGQAFIYKLAETENAYFNAKSEIVTNYLSIVSLTEKLLPLLKQQPEAAIINVSSIVAFAPSLSLPTYSASKAALHSYTKILRLALSQTTKIKVFEVMPPLVDTEFAKDIPSDKKISPLAVATELMNDFESDHFEIRVGSVKEFYNHFLNSPEIALLSMNGIKNPVVSN